MKMGQIYGISLVAVLLCLQIVFVPFRSAVVEPRVSHRPRMSLPVAAQNRICCSLPRVHDEISWSKEEGWMITNFGVIREEQLENYLRSVVKRSEDHGDYPRVRIRIPDDTPACKFIKLTQCMERVGVRLISISYTTPGRPWI